MLKACRDGKSLDEDSEFTLVSVFEIGHIDEQIVPRAVLLLHRGGHRG